MENNRINIISHDQETKECYFTRGDSQNSLGWVPESAVTDMARALGQIAYEAAVTEIAAECIEEHPKDENAQDEMLWESVDGSSWVIYTHKNLQVLLYTSNDDAWQEFGELDKDNWLAQIAFAAMLADCRAELQRLRDENQEEAEEEADPE